MGYSEAEPPLSPYDLSTILRDVVVCRLEPPFGGAMVIKVSSWLLFSPLGGCVVRVDSTKGVVWLCFVSTRSLPLTFFFSLGIPSGHAAFMDQQDDWALTNIQGKAGVGEQRHCREQSPRWVDDLLIPFFLIVVVLQPELPLAVTVVIGGLEFAPH